jgi:acyl carrier protein
LYKTGDLGRWRHDGLLEHLGLLDHQVKVRGFRIELGEIEAALMAHAGVQEALVSTWAPQADDVRLVAYVVPAGGTAAGTADASAQPSLDGAALRASLRARLPDFMLPQSFMQLERLPRLPNGKVDRSQLPPPDFNANAPVVSMAPARIDALTSEEQAISEIWGALLGTQDIGPADNFFDLGGHSLLAMRAIVAIEKRLGVRIHPRRLIFENLGQLARTETTAN